MRDSAARGCTKLSSMWSSLRRLLDDRELIGRVVDDEVARQADCRRLAAQQARAERVKGRNPHAAAVRAQQGLDALAHFSGGLVRERHRENLVGLGVAVADEIRDPAGDDAGLARPGAREDQQRPLDVKHRGALFGVERCEKIHSVEVEARG